MRPRQGGGQASPPYPLAHGGPCIVAGNAFCLHEDLERAPRVPVIAVNGAAREVRAFALYSQHPERFVSLRWIDRQRRGFGDGFTVHASEPMAHVDYCWRAVRKGGGSAWGARKLAWCMGFDPVILCGCPLEAGNYANHAPGQLMTKQKVIEELREQIAAETEWHEGACSMSGWTRDLLGAC